MDKANKGHIVFLVIIGTAFMAMAVVFNCLPRPTYSELERRELAEFPEFTPEKVVDGSFAAALSSWFSDTEPFREDFLTANMAFKAMLAFNLQPEDETVVLHAETPAAPAAKAADEDTSTEIEEFKGGDGTAKLASNGIYVVGKAPTARALMIYGGHGGGKLFAEAANKIHKELGVKVYAMVIPSAIEYYLPEKARKGNRSIASTVKSVHSMLDPEVRGVDVYTALGQHVEEPIFLRTDHHWSHLGAYYAARELCKAAGVKVPDIKDYDKKTVHNFVGTMFGYSKDISIKNSPEDFDYYEPKVSDYTVKHITYTLDKDFNILSSTPWQNGHFFHHFKDGASGAYSTFLGTDQRITKISCASKNGRKILILKDSYGNALPSWLFGSFEEVYVIDFRYFDRNLRKFVKDNGITDIVVANNVFNVYSGTCAKKYIKFLDQ